MSSEFDLPLFGKIVVITRAQEQQGEARDLFHSKGAKVLDLPALVIGPPEHWGPLDEALAQFEDFHWIIFSSINGVNAVEARLQSSGRTLANKPNHLKIAVVGRKTALSLENLGVVPDFVPPNFVADSLINHFPVSAFGLKMLIPRVQTGGRTVLAEAFGKAGAHVIEVAAYESSCPEDMPEETARAFLQKEIDAINFTSSKTAVHTAHLMRQRFGIDWQQNLDGINLISIGPQTSISCHKYFYRVDKEANPHNIVGLINACISSFKKE